jgi:large subunit ribosomal protein L18
MRNVMVKKRLLEKKRGWRVRRKLHGTAQRPRLSVNKSNAHIQAQLIDDDKGVTLGSVATFGKEFRETEFSKKNKASARKIGARIAEIAQRMNVESVVFDRGSFKYHGILAELADAARSGGLKF